MQTRDLSITHAEGIRSTRRAVVTGVAARPNPIARVEERKQREPETNRGRRRGRVPGRERGRGGSPERGGIDRGGMAWSRREEGGGEVAGAAAEREGNRDLEWNGWTGCSATPRVLRLPGFRMAPLFIRARAAGGGRVDDGLVGGKGRARTTLLTTQYLCII